MGHQAWADAPTKQEPKLLSESDFGDPARLAERELQRRKADAVTLIRRTLPEYLVALRRGELQALRARVKDQSGLQLADQWNPYWHGNLIVLGYSGAGKSAIGGVLFHRLVAEGVMKGGHHWDLAQGMRWVDCEELARTVRTHRKDGDPAEYVAARDASILFLDEVGSEDNPQTVTDLVAWRFKRQRTTVFLSGRTREGAGSLTEKYGAPLVRKMRESGGKRMVFAEQLDDKTPWSIKGLERRPQPEDRRSGSS